EGGRRRGRRVGRRIHDLASVDEPQHRLVIVAEEAAPKPPEDVIDDRLRDRNLRVASEPTRLEADVRELVHQVAERDTVLERDGDRRGERVHEAGDGRAFLRHLQEDLAGLAVWVEPDGDVALVAGDVKLVGDGRALRRQSPTMRLARLDGGGSQLVLE